MLSDPGPGWFGQLLPEGEVILDEEALLDFFTRCVEEFIHNDMGLLLSLLYRMDVEEHKIQRVLHSLDVPPSRGIAQLIIDRQKERLRTRREYSSGKEGDWEGL